ncbi:MAG: CDP-alcohol phosphatidyltransferase family protein [Alphaproteobacteria bacterium]
MPTLYDIKPRFQALLKPFVSRLARRGVTPNQITGLALALSATVGGLLLALPGQRWMLVVLALALFVRMALNALDGMLARDHDLTSRFGALFNEVADVVSDGVLYLPLAAALLPFGVSAPAVIAFAVSGIIAEFAGAIAPMVGAARRYDGPMGKSDRALLAGTVAVWVALDLPDAGGAALTLVFGLAAALGLWTIANRLRAALGTRTSS